MAGFKPWRFPGLERIWPCSNSRVVFAHRLGSGIVRCVWLQSDWYRTGRVSRRISNSWVAQFNPDRPVRPSASLAALRGQSVLFDFIYTSCPGPCQLLTQHMKLIANKLGPALGSGISLVSVTVDPEHDRPNRLFDYTRAFDANVKGWYFLTGSSAQIDQLMSGFRLARTRASDGEIEHILGFFLVDPSGHPTVEYSERVQPSIAAREAETAASGNSVIAWVSSEFRNWI
jgi:cytochrome oxidase Cu insertion factor (SCO1/SenC/PrrC family)